MAEDDDVIVPSSGNTALDPTKAVNGLVGKVTDSLRTADAKQSPALRPSEALKPSAALQRSLTPTEEKNLGRPVGGDSGKADLEGYWTARKSMEMQDEANGIEKRPKSIIRDGGGHGASGSVRQRSGKFGISGAARRDFGIMKFKSQTFTDACSGAYTCIFPLSGYLPQVCGPFRPITIESIGGFPQSLSQEASNVGGPVNSDEV